jgi:hypothetical protein
MLYTIDSIDGSSPVQATGTIDHSWVFYFRGRGGRWQFVAGPKELSPHDLSKVMLGFVVDERVFVIQGDDDNHIYLDYEWSKNIISIGVQQFAAWYRVKERGDATQSRE